MSTDCLCEYHGRVSRDILRVWSCWASTVIHGQCYKQGLGQHYTQDRGQRYEQDYWQRYAPGRWPRYALGCGQRYVLTSGRATVGTTSAPPCHWTFGPVDRLRRYISMDIETQCPWSPQQES